MAKYRISEQPWKYDDKTVREATMDDVLAFTESERIFCIDTETTGLNPRKDRVLSIQIGNTKNQFIIDGTHSRITELKTPLQALDKKKVGANLGFDYKMLLSNYGIRMENVYDVSRVDEVLFNGLYSGLEKGHYYKTFSLASLCKRHLGLDISKKEREQFIGMKYFSSFTPKLIAYACSDVIYPLQIRDKQTTLLSRYGLHACATLENDVVLAVADMEYNGVALDVVAWRKMADENQLALDKAMLDIDTLIVEKLGLTEFKVRQVQLDMFDPGLSDKRKSYINWRSPDDVLKVFHKLKFNVKDTNRRTLNVLAESSEFVTRFLKLRELIKTVDSYGHAFLEHVDPETNRIYPTFNQLFPDTGRLSCDSPNLQNIKRGSVYRHSFIAPENRMLLTSDYSGQELRLMAAISGEESWIRAFKNNEDLHGNLAVETFDIPKESIKDQAPFAPSNTTYRDVQKTIDFMIPYGGGPDKLAEVFRMHIDKAKLIIDTFLRKVPKVAKYLKETGQFGRDNGYVRTFAPIGRIRWFRKHAELFKMDEYQRNKVLGEIERAACNLPIQGSGADLVKTAMVDTRNWIREHNAWNTVKMILQVHDELVDEVATEFVEHWKDIKRDIMLKAGAKIVREVPMEVSISVDTKWTK